MIIAKYLVDVELVKENTEKSGYNLNANSQTVPKTAQEKLMAIPLDTIMLEKALDVAINEYAFERGKRSSFESRAGIVLTLLLTFLVFFIGNYSFIDSFIAVCGLFHYLDLNVCLRVMLADAILMYLFISKCCKCSYSAWLIIKTKKYQNTNLDKLEPQFIMSKKIAGLPVLIKCYKEIIEEHRAYNEKYALYIMNSIESLIFVVVFGLINLALH